MRQVIKFTLALPNICVLDSKEADKNHKELCQVHILRKQSYFKFSLDII